MNIFSYKDRWIKTNEKYHRYWSSLFLCLVSLSFIVSDWMLGLFTFSEYILGIVIALIAITGQFKITKIQIKFISGTIFLLFVHLILQETLNESFFLKTGTAAFIKLSFYMLITSSLYNYVIENRLKKKFLMMNNIFAIVTCVIGLYIVIAIYSNSLLPFEFIWNFTRSDVTSYVFNNGDISFVRMRSIFSEPSYFGFYLNTILAMNYLNSTHIKVNKKISTVISISILLTLSYSAIAIMLLITTVYILSEKQERLKKNRRKSLFVALIIIMFIIIMYILFQDFFNSVFIQRTIETFTNTNNSGYSRLFGSWKYVNENNFLLGNGLGHTPAIWNIYAYMISDLGIFGLIYFVVVTWFIVKSNKKLGVFFIVMNFSKGGYLSSSFWMFFLLTMIYSNTKEKYNDLNIQME